MRTSALFLLLAGLLLACPARADDLTRDDLEERIDRLQESFRSVMGEGDSGIPNFILTRARGIIIFRKYEGGFIFGGKGGFGLALVRHDDGTWSGPAFLKTGEGSFGLQFGAQSLDVVYVIMNEEGMHLLSQTKFRIGVDAGATAGPAGGQTEAKTGPNAPPIYYFANTSGLYAGATLEGGFLLPDGKANEVYTGREGISMREILFEKPGPQKSPAARSLIRAISRHLLPSR